MGPNIGAPRCVASVIECTDSVLDVVEIWPRRLFSARFHSERFGNRVVSTASKSPLENEDPLVDAVLGDYLGTNFGLTKAQWVDAHPNLRAGLIPGEQGRPKMTDPEAAHRLLATAWMPAGKHRVGMAERFGYTLSGAASVLIIFDRFGPLSEFEGSPQSGSFVLTEQGRSFVFEQLGIHYVDS